MRCLVVGDEPIIVEAVTALLGHLCDVVPSVDAVDALALINAEQFDSIITDLNMPNVDGIACAMQHVP